MTLHKIMAGPIVRRVERDAVSIWFALDDDHDVEVKIWQGLKDADTADPEITPTETLKPKFRLGPNLIVTLITLRFDDPLVLLGPGRVYSYDATIGGENLATLDLLKNIDPSGTDREALDYKPGRLALGYSENTLPSFVTPQETLDQIALAHGSCRRPHGPDEDAIRALDDVINGAQNSAGTRPQQLFLTGDQIYADDVALPLLPMLNTLGGKMFAQVEELQKTAGTVPITNQHLPAGRRAAICEKEAKFTSGSASSHLISFAEYSAMYVCAFCPDAWHPLASEADVFTANRNDDDQLTPLNTLETLNRKSGEPENDGRRKDYREQLKRVAAYRDALPAARRALANIATYMIFDDHEVTDDWNLTRTWRKEVLATRAGRQILRNGHVAYAFFQGWGNDPKVFSEKANLALLQLGPTMISQFGTHDPTIADTIDKSIRHGTFAGAQAKPDDIDAQTPADGGRVKWNTTLNCANYDIVILDTRTARSYDGDFTPPNLLGATLGSQLKTGDGADFTKDFLLLISAAPVLSPPLIDRIGQPLGVAAVDLFKGRKDGEFIGKGVSTVDAEGWGGNEAAQEALLDKLAPFKRVVMLSGDVHYGYSMTLDYWRKTSPDPARFVQLVASGMHNAFNSLVQSLNRASTIASEILGGGARVERLIWKSSDAPLFLPPGVRISPSRRSRLRIEPVMLPADGWPADVTTNPNNEPDARWRLALVYDDRPDADRPSAQGQDPFGADITFDDPIDSYFRVAGFHNAQAAKRPNVRSFVQDPNFGLVRFSGSSPNLTVQHEIYSQDVKTPTGQDLNTKHKIAFTATGDAAPELRQ